ncbi:hypothetical protein [uncultured Fibrobacter sp.]|uniref:hypothetical protein n=1 Tax=uncultured Fibrobacter sp. TaxID=261512 RepID=UPI0025ED99C5|nr:hypothetical protein [uncultured Fibrobacter sp.]
MEKQKKKSVLKEALFIEWVFFCVYWGTFAIVWHFASFIENDSGKSVLYESNWLVPISSIFMYLIGVYYVFVTEGRR